MKLKGSQLLLPVSKRFLEDFNKVEICKEFGLDPEKETVLFFAGGEFGLGRNTKEQRKFFLSRDNRTSSNGWLLASASFGIFYLVYFLYVMYKGIRHINFKVNNYFILAVLIFQQCNEAAIFLPYIFMYIFMFKRYEANQLIDSK